MEDYIPESIQSMWQESLEANPAARHAPLAQERRQWPGKQESLRNPPRTVLLSEYHPLAKTEGAGLLSGWVGLVLHDVVNHSEPEVQPEVPLGFLGAWGGLSP